MASFPISVPLLAAFALGYLLGSIPFGLLLTRAAGLGDVRKIGSGNIGATNVLRTGNKGLAAITLLLDALKGTAAVLLAGVLGGVEVQLAAGLGAFIGHIAPVWLGFSGGKGVATYIGVLLGLHWPAALLFCGLWIAAAVLFRYSSLSALLASLAVPVYYLVGKLPGIGIIVGITLLLILKHHANIRRLLAGEEPRIGARSKSE
ncbi:MAG: glycerol-3-phosphate 1-O-acyltransferase PlsY [Hyphomicrobiaceae bacterium]|nr:glycerol-3-phosphate 1-O-acyltransferase PlsY [Hyphomicrobiaceae bacterium]